MITVIIREFEEKVKENISQLYDRCRYNICLGMTLLEKSLVLMATGLVFIIFRLSLIWLLKTNEKGE